MPAAACPQPATAPAARAYRPRRPAATLLHELVRTNLETWLATAAERDEYGSGVPLHVAAALRNYLKCGILAHGFARVYCGNCRTDFMVTFSCKGATCARRAPRAAWSTSLPIWSTRCCPACGTGSGCCRCPSASGGTCGTSRRWSAAF
ncbi:MAG: transposase zinc-binding domain-containing protein [bacterium]|nr:transposase zinc-binding domain-containing protein [bacterium]